MGENKSGSARVSRGTSARASASALATQDEISACVSLTPEELKALIPRALQTANLDLRPFLRLTPYQVSELMKLPEWQKLCDAMLGMAVLNRGESLTKNQRWGIAYFRKNAYTPKAEQGRKAHAFDEARVIEITDNEDPE